MTGIETDAVLFHGVDRGWMQAQWRDCKDKAEQLKIFQDMTDRKATVQEILDAVGEPEYCGPMEPMKREYRRWTPEDDARIAEMVAEGMTDKQIADALGRNPFSVSARIKNLRKRGVMIVREKGKPEDVPEKADTEPETEPEKPDVYPDGGALPLEIGDLPDSDALEEVGKTLRALLDEEEMLCDRCRVVQDMISAYRAKLRELLAMAGGGLTDGKD
jgi:transposase-like protein